MSRSERGTQQYDEVNREYETFADRLTQTTECIDCGSVVQYVGYTPARCDPCENHWQEVHGDED